MPENESQETKESTPEERSAAARALGSVRSERKAAAVRENGKLGGRKKGFTMTEEHKAKLREAAQRNAAAKKAGGA